MLYVRFCTHFFFFAPLYHWHIASECHSHTFTMCTNVTRYSPSHIRNDKIKRPPTKWKKDGKKRVSLPIFDIKWHIPIQLRLSHFEFLITIRMMRRASNRFRMASRLVGAADKTKKKLQQTASKMLCTCTICIKLSKPKKRQTHETKTLIFFPFSDVVHNQRKNVICARTNNHSIWVGVCVCGMEICVAGECKKIAYGIWKDEPNDRCFFYLLRDVRLWHARTTACKLSSSYVISGNVFFCVCLSPFHLCHLLSFCRIECALQQNGVQKNVNRMCIAYCELWQFYDVEFGNHTEINIRITGMWGLWHVEIAEKKINNQSSTYTRMMQQKWNYILSSVCEQAYEFGRFPLKLQECFRHINTLIVARPQYTNHSSL